VLPVFAERASPDPKESFRCFPDGMDVGSIEETYRHFAGRVRISFGWGTNLTNDFVGCAPDGSTNLDPISIVCKVTSIDGRPAVELSDNPEKRRVVRPRLSIICVYSATRAGFAARCMSEKSAETFSA
jgi:hypothetical protein